MHILSLESKILEPQKQKLKHILSHGLLLLSLTSYLKKEYGYDDIFWIY